MKKASKVVKNADKLVINAGKVVNNAGKVVINAGKVGTICSVFVVINIQHFDLYRF